MHVSILVATAIADGVEHAQSATEVPTIEPMKILYPDRKVKNVEADARMYQGLITSPRQ